MFFVLVVVGTEINKRHLECPSFLIAQRTKQCEHLSKDITCVAGHGKKPSNAA